MRPAIAVIIIMLLLTVSAAADDLFRVQISSAEEAEILAATGVAPIARVSSAYLVLAKPEAAERLLAGPLTSHLIASGLSAERLAIDNRLDRTNVDRYPLLYEEDHVRIYNIESDEYPWDRGSYEVRPVEPDHIPIIFPDVSVSTTQLEIATDGSQYDYDSIVNLMSQDTLQSYLERLQAFYRRTCGTDSSFASRDWLVSKLHSFGYDSVVVDSFWGMRNDSLLSFQNVLAYKVGATYPYQHVIVGAHRDAVPQSPGADDNGTGTVAVLEMARVLADIETDVTIVFAMFDAEEYGLYGAHYYASQAYNRDDNINFMLNMDMIGHYTNDSEATIFHGYETPFGQVWANHASALVGITAHLTGVSSGSDHYPFYLYGFPAIFVHEWEFSTVYHTRRDSTTYVNFDYFTRMARASLATVLTASESAQPIPSVWFSYPSEIPAELVPAADTSFVVQLTTSTGTSIVPGSGTLHYSIYGGAWQTDPLEDLGGQQYRAALPAMFCNRQIEFYVTFDESHLGTVSDCLPETPHRARVVTDGTVHWQDNFESDLAWFSSGSSSQGRWQRGPVMSYGASGSPTADYDGSGQCYVTGNVARDGDVDEGYATLISPTIDLTGTDPELQMAIWFSNDKGSAPYEDVLTVWLSATNGGSWVAVDTLGPVAYASGGWYLHSYRVSDFVTPNGYVRLKVEVSDLNNESEVEAGLDAVRFVTSSCQTNLLCGDYNFDIAGPDISDLTYLVNFLFLDGSPPPEPAVANVNGTGGIDISDLTLLVNHLFVTGQELVCWQ